MLVAIAVSSSRESPSTRAHASKAAGSCAPAARLPGRAPNRHGEVGAVARAAPGAPQADEEPDQPIPILGDQRQTLRGVGATGCEGRCRTGSWRGAFARANGRCAREGHPIPVMGRAAPGAAVVDFRPTSSREEVPKQDVKQLTKQT